ncbi:MAG: hypothetical protein FWE10_04160 [Rikenellaceae bacterium]|nr:hypothetical protein [Rikenellaceae bacterium]MCL2692919.1 hypothetical protein [Rikenellaceae bacterium]
MWKWFRRQDALTKAVVVLCVVLAVAVAVRWRHISTKIWNAYGYPFRRAPQEQVVVSPPPAQDAVAVEIRAQDDENSDN